MATRLLYNDEGALDAVLILSFIDEFTTKLEVKGVVIDPDKVTSITTSCRSDFPYNGGVKAASAFKQVANFVCFFIAERPILEPFDSAVIGLQLATIPNHENAIVAFAIAEAALLGSTIKRKDGDFKVDNPIHYSDHSYVDIIDALANVTPSTHFKLVTVLLEQMVYKTNGHCQYPIA